MYVVRRLNLVPFQEIKFSTLCNVVMRVGCVVGSSKIYKIEAVHTAHETMRAGNCNVIYLAALNSKVPEFSSLRLSLTQECGSVAK